MNGSAVSWGFGAALAIVASVAIWRLSRPPARREAAYQRTDSALHLLMALGMAAMLLPHGGSVTTVLVAGFGAGTVVLAIRGRLHHAVMAGIMALMMRAEQMPASVALMSVAPSNATSINGDSTHAAVMRMAMPTGGPGASPLLIAAFCYAAVSACVFAWRLPAFAAHGPAAGSRRCAADPLGRGCEIMMLISTAVMLLPMI